MTPAFTHAVWVLREEIIWKRQVMDRSQRDLADDRIPAGLVRDKLAQLALEIADMETAADLLEGVSAPLELATLEPGRFDFYAHAE